MLLTRQFRYPVYVNGHPDGMLIETAAGLLDDDEPEAAIRREAIEETGHEVGELEHVFDVYMSPGSVTERMHFYAAPYAAETARHAGGGLADEGEEIDVVELDFDAALALIGTEIVDAKTIMLLQWAALRARSPLRGARRLGSWHPSPTSRSTSSPRRAVDGVPRERPVRRWRAAAAAQEDSSAPGITWQEALDVALCFGWIDGQAGRFDDDYTLQAFTPRRKNSPWSQINQGHVARLIEAGRMRPGGQAEIDRAKADGRWDAAYRQKDANPAPTSRRPSTRAPAAAAWAAMTKVNRFAMIFRIAG